MEEYIAEEVSAGNAAVHVGVNKDVEGLHITQSLGGWRREMQRGANGGKCLKTSCPLPEITLQTRRNLASVKHNYVARPEARKPELLIIKRSFC